MVNFSHVESVATTLLIRYENIAPVLVEEPWKIWKKFYTDALEKIS